MRPGHGLDQRYPVAAPQAASVVDVDIDRIAQERTLVLNAQGKIRKAVVYSKERPNRLCIHYDHPTNVGRAEKRLMFSPLSDCTPCPCKRPLTEDTV